MSDVELLAHILQGEAAGCGLMAMVAVAWVYSHNRTMYGWDTPGPLALWAATYWSLVPDPTGGARFIVSTNDLRLPAVRALTVDRGPPTWVSRECSNGQQLWAFE